MIENVIVKESVVESYVGKGDVNIKMLRGGVRRPSSERVWTSVENGLTGKRKWENVKIKWNSIECEHFEFLLRHNRRECDVCKDQVESRVHEFVECRELVVYFGRMKELVSRCWNEWCVREMEWKEFGECNVGLLNYVLSHARHAVKIRRNSAHYQGKMPRVGYTEKDSKKGRKPCFPARGQRHFLRRFYGQQHLLLSSMRRELCGLI
ncbi:hypothetical protein F7725_029176 [Dissostichus mawsoni]|uniref:Uncharacterized protein n=1 Tax=Dissostichus mawsoni TaxID=36200 RepID=A0A7J5XK98_DISMA|nr:hypothetical protein F7725_029176 [Dissostichus mawsoni]